MKSYTQRYGTIFVYIRRGKKTTEEKRERGRERERERERRVEKSRTRSKRKERDKRKRVYLFEKRYRVASMVLPLLSSSSSFLPSTYPLSFPFCYFLHFFTHRYSCAPCFVLLLLLDSFYLRVPCRPARLPRGEHEPRTSRAVA